MGGMGLPRGYDFPGRADLPEAGGEGGEARFVLRTALRRRAIPERDCVEVELEGVAGCSGHADVGYEPGHDHGADAAVAKQPLQPGAEERAVAVLDEGHISRLGLERWV